MRQHAPIAIGIIGTGSVGSELIKQIEARKHLLYKKTGIDLRLIGSINTTRMILGEHHINTNDEPADFNKFLKHVKEDKESVQSVLIDVTSANLTTLYIDWLKAKGALVTANKIPLAGSNEDYDKIKSVAGNRLRYSATVGAGLPILSTIRRIVDTQDRILDISGVFSGTLSYLFNNYNGLKSFSQLVGEAKDAGYTEPNPKIDLMGGDVMRKMIIICREMEMHPVENFTRVDSLVDLSDNDVLKLFEEAKAKQHRLVYKANIDRSAALKASIVSVGAESPLYGLSGTQNVAYIRSYAHNNHGIVVKGSGAGTEVTANALLADIIDIAKGYLK